MSIYGLGHAPAEARVVLLPVPLDATASYRRGAADGPRAILAASRQVELFDVETGRPDRAGIAMLDEDAELRAWNDEARAADPARVNALGAEVNRRVEQAAEAWLARDKIVGTVGVDHAAAFGAIAAHARRWPGMGILQLDAHADLRRAFQGYEWSHASIMDNVMRRLTVARLVQVGVRDLDDEEHDAIAGSGGRVVAFFDAALHNERFAGVPWAAQVARIVDALPSDVYLSFDVDGLDPSLCPHTGTPVPGGLGFAEACALVAAVARSGRRIVGFDLCEVAPGPDGDEWDGNVGARLLYKMIGWTLTTR